MAVRPGHRTVYVAEQTGRVRAISNGQLDPGPVPDVSPQIVAGGEQGLLGLLSPDGRFLYVDFTDRNGDTTTRKGEHGMDYRDPAISSQPWPCLADIADHRRRPGRGQAGPRQSAP